MHAEPHAARAELLIPRLNIIPQEVLQGYSSGDVFFERYKIQRQCTTSVFLLYPLLADFLISVSLGMPQKLLSTSVLYMGFSYSLMSEEQSKMTVSLKDLWAC